MKLYALAILLSFPVILSAMEGVREWPRSADGKRYKRIAEEKRIIGNLEKLKDMTDWAESEIEAKIKEDYTEKDYQEWEELDLALGKIVKSAEDMNRINEAAIMAELPIS